MYCPMLKCQCHLHDCAWFNVSESICSIRVLARAQSYVTDHLADIAKALKLVEGKVSIMGVVNENL